MEPYARGWVTITQARKQTNKKNLEGSWGKGCGGLAGAGHVKTALSTGGRQGPGDPPFPSPNCLALFLPVLPPLPLNSPSLF